MKAKRITWNWAALLAAGLSCGATALTASGQEPAFPASAAAVQHPYDATTPEAAVQWLAKARASGDADAEIQALAAPLGPAMHDLMVAVRQWGDTLNRFQNTKAALTGRSTVSEPAWKSDRDNAQRAGAAKQVFAVREMKIEWRRPVPKLENEAVELFIRTTLEDGNHDQQTRTQTCVAVREGKVWRLLPKSVWILVKTPDGRKSVRSCNDNLIAWLNKTRDLTEGAIQLLRQGKPVDELVLLTAWEQVAGKIPSVGGTEDNPDQKAMMEVYDFARQEAEGIIQRAR